MSMTDLIRCGLVLLFAAPASAQDEAMAYPPAKVEVVQAELREMAPQVDISGTVVSLNDARIGSEVEGVLTWLADVGTAVSAGDVLARIDPRLLSVALRQAEAAVGRLEAELSYRERELKRNQDLAATKNASETLLDESRAQRDQALHQLADARARLERAEGDLARSEIRAPFSGHLVERLGATGEYVTVGEDVIRLVDTGHIEIALPVPIDLVPFLQPGLELPVRDANKQRQHRVRGVVPVGDPVSRMVEVRLQAQPGDWLVGAPVTVSVPRGEAITAVAVPRDALVQRGGSSLIYVVEEGTVRQLEAKLRTIVGLWVGLTEGIEVGDQVVIRGGERLQPGQPVEVISGAPGAGG